MFEELFAQPSTIERYRSAPFAEERLRYLQHQAEAGASRGTLRNVAIHQLCLVGHLELTPGESVPVCQVEVAARKQSCLARRSHREPALPAQSTAFFSHAVQWLRFLGWLFGAIGARQSPCLHAFRHSFAVHRLTAWYPQGADVQRLLPILSTYLGHQDPAGTQVYLSMTPQLLQQASLRFERYERGGNDE